jgi:hypothetical protein
MIQDTSENSSVQDVFALVNFSKFHCISTYFFLSTLFSTLFIGKIKNMFSEEEFGPLTRLVLVNAIYFKGDWKQKFRKEDTEMTDFTKKDGSTVKVPMMKALLRAQYGNVRNYIF